MVRQHPQLGNRFVSFVRATRAFRILRRFRTKMQMPTLIFYLCPRAPVSFTFWACIFYLLGSYLLSLEVSETLLRHNCRGDVLKTVLNECLLRQFLEESQSLQRVLKESSQRESLERVLRQSSYREFLKGNLWKSSQRNSSSRKFLKRVRRESSQREVLKRVLEEGSGESCL